MRIPNPPFHDVSNGLLYAILTGGDCIGYEEVIVRSDQAVKMKFPPKTAYAILIVEADKTCEDKTKVIRFKEFDTIESPPSGTDGIPLGDLSIYEVKGITNLNRFRAIGIEAGKEHSIKVQYFG